MNEQKRKKNLIGDVYDILAGNTNYITQKMFASRHPEMEVNYDSLQIRLGKKYVITLQEIS